VLLSNSGTFLLKFKSKVRVPSQVINSCLIEWQRVYWLAGWLLAWHCLYAM